MGAPAAHFFLRFMLVTSRSHRGISVAIAAAKSLGELAITTIPSPSSFLRTSLSASALGIYLSNSMLYAFVQWGGNSKG